MMDLTLLKAKTLLIENYNGEGNGDLDGTRPMNRKECKKEFGWKFVKSYRRKNNYRIIEICNKCNMEFDYNPSSCRILMGKGCNDLKIHVGIRIPESVNKKVTALKNELGFTTRNAAFTYILSSFFKEDQHKR